MPESRSRLDCAQSSARNHSHHRLPAAAVAFLLAGVLAALPCAAQSLPGDRSKPLPYLLDVGDMFALVRYSPGALDRASHVQRRFALLAEDFRKWSKQPVPLSVVLLSRTDWEALDLAVPYGLPAHLANGEVALCAWGDLGTVNLWRSLLGGELPANRGPPALRVSRSRLRVCFWPISCPKALRRARCSIERASGGAHPDVLNLAAHVVALAASNLHESLSLGEIRGSTR